MSWSNRTYGDRPCVNTGDISDPWKDRQFIPSVRVVADECWCGGLKHIKQMVCWACQKLVEGKE